jgi:hypothetical protein
MVAVTIIRSEYPHGSESKSGRQSFRHTLAADTGGKFFQLATDCRTLDETVSVF